MKRMFRLAEALAQSLCLPSVAAQCPKEFAGNGPRGSSSAADIAPIEIEKGEGKHDDIADIQLPSPTT